MVRSPWQTTGGMRRIFLRLLIAALLAAGLAAGASAQERIAISGTAVSLVPLDGFTPSSRFPGFEHAEAEAALRVVELPPEAHAQLLASFSTADAAGAIFARQKIFIEKAEDIETAAGKGRLLTGQQNFTGTVFRKWIMLLKGVKTTMIIVHAPAEPGLDSSEIVAMLKSVSLNTPSTRD